MPLEIRNDGSGRVLVPLHLHPGARRAGPAGLHGGALKILVKSPPRGGRANAELLELLAGLLGVAKGSVELVRGHKSRDKLAAVSGLSVERVAALLAPHVKE